MEPVEVGIPGGVSPWALVDRTRYETQHGRCARLRWLQFHAGPYGYGIRRKAHSLPLVGGAAIHEILGRIGRDSQSSGGAINEDGVRLAIREAQAAYHRSVAEYGMVGFVEADLLPLIEEQQALIEGLTWAVVLHVLRPWCEEYDILATEQDIPFVVGCQCGAAEAYGVGMGSLAHHIQRGCQETATLQMFRPDLVLRHKISHRVVYVEYKTTSSLSERFLTEWPTKMQFALGGLAVEANLGVTVDEYCVVGLNKGYRSGEYNPETRRYDGAEYQKSLACYAYRKLGDPPVSQEQWAPKFQYTDEMGVTRRLGKGWDRTRTTLYPARPGETPVESYIKTLDPRYRQELVTVVGPLFPKRIILEKLATQVAINEETWRERLWMLHERSEGLIIPTEDPIQCWEEIWQTQEYQDLLDQLFPQSFDCRRYGERYKCEMEKLCFFEAGWDRPISDDGAGYGWRAPHHALEQQQMRERGLEIALTSDEDQDAGGGGQG